MSGAYVTEPPTSGKLVLNTSVGPLDIELWPKQAPKACRNFVQLCLEGYYDGTIFHRVVKDFMVQGGDPTGTGDGGESIYGRGFEDEFHSRLHFTHRGIVAMANDGTKNSNKSQFFITLARTDHLEKRNTIFGKVTGDSIYNLLHFNELELDASDRPVYPPVIKSVTVLWNPFEDIVPREIIKAEPEKPAAKPKRPKVKNFGLLSFGEEAHEEEELVTKTISSGAMKMKGSYVLETDEETAARLKEQQQALLAAEEKLRQKDDMKRKLQAATSDAAAAASGHADRSADDNEDSGNFAEAMRRKVEQKRSAAAATPSSTSESGGSSASTNTATTPTPTPPTGGRKRRLVDEQREQYKKRRLTSPERKQKTLEKLSMFQQTLRQVTIEQAYSSPTPSTSSSSTEPLPAAAAAAAAPAAAAAAAPEEDETLNGDKTWLAHPLRFEKSSRVRDPSATNYDDSYVTIDPLKDARKPTKHELHARRLQKREHTPW